MKYKDITEEHSGKGVEKHQSTAHKRKLEDHWQWFYDEYHTGCQNHYAGIFKSSKDAIGYVTLDGLLIDVNDAFLDLTGYSKEDLIDKKKYQEITPKEYHEYEARKIDKILATGKPQEYEKEYTRRDGSRVPILLTTFLVKDSSGNAAGLGAIIKDISERKQARQILQESEERYRTLIENTYDLICEVAIDGRFLYANRKHREILGYDPGELLGRSIFDFVHPEDYYAAQSEFKRALKSFSSAQLVCRYRHKSGDWLWLECTGRPFRTPNGGILGFIASRDITQQRRAEKALRESEERYRNLFEHIPIGMYRTTPDGRILLANPALIKMLGFSSLDELALRDLEKEGFSSEFTRAEFKSLMEEMGEVTGLEYSWLKQDGAVIDIRESARAIRAEDGSVLYYEGAVEDITEHKALFHSSLAQANELKFLYDNLNKRNRELEILNKITQAVHKSLDLEEVYNVALDMVMGLDNVDMAFIYLVDWERMEAVLQAHRNVTEDYIKRAGRIPYPKGLTWRIINSGEVVNIGNMQKDLYVGPAGRDLGHNSAIGIPITLKGLVIGVIYFASHKEDRFDKQEVDLLSAIGNQIAIAVARAKQSEDLHQANRDLSTLNRIAISIHNSLNLQEIYNIAVEAVLNLTGFDILIVYLVDEDTNEAVLQAQSGLTEEFIRRAGKIPYPKGVTWKVINSGEMVFVDDVQRDPDLGPAGRALGHHTQLAVPIKQAEKTIGVIYFISLQVLKLSSHYIDILKTIGSQIGTAIAKAHVHGRSLKQAEELKALYYDLDKRNRELEILNKITQAVHGSIDLEEVYNIALDMVTALENIDMAMIYLVDEDRKEAILRASRNIPEDYIKRAGRIPYPTGITWKVINSGLILNVKDAQKEPDIGPAGRDLGHHGILGIPITLEGEAMGVIWFFTYKERQFDRQEIDLLSSIGNQIAIAVAKAKQTEDLRLVNRDLSILNRIAISIHKSLNLQEIYNIAINTVLNMTSFDILMIYLVDEDTDEAVLQAHSGLTEDYIKRAGRIPFPKGVTWKVINSGEMVFIDDVQRDPDLGPAGRALGHRTELGIPIKQAEKTIGVIFFASLRALKLSSHDVSVLKTIGSQIGTAIAKAHLYRRSRRQAKEVKALYYDLDRRNKELEILNTVTQAVHQSIDLEEVYNIALDRIMALENIDMAMIYLVDSERNEAVLQASRDIPEDYIRRAGRIPYPMGITWKVINSCHILNVKDAQKEPGIGPAGRDLGHHGILGIPITLEGKAIGVIWFFTYKERQFDRQEIDLLSSIGSQIALAIAKAKLYRELSKKNRYEKIISAVTRSVHQSIHLQDVLENAVDAMSKNVDQSDAIGIYLVEGDEAVIRAHRGFDDFYLRQAGKIPYPKGYTWKTIIEGKPSYIADVDEDTSIGPAGRQAGIKSYLSMPIRFEGKTVGCVNINSFEKNAFDKEELKLLEIVSQQIETAINNAQIAEHLRLKSLIVGNMAEGVGIARASDNIIVYANTTFEKMFGYSPDELIGKSALILNPFGDNALEHPEIRKIIECVEQNDIWVGELQFVKKDGTLFWSHASVSTFEHPQHGKLWVGIHTDITERKRAEVELKNSNEQLRKLAAHLQSVREEERTIISREIHDELAQVLSGLKMSLSWLNNKLSENGGDDVSRSHVFEEIEAMSKLVDDTIQTARRVATELRPRILDDLGLMPAIEWLVQEFQGRTGIRCKLSSNLDSVNLDQAQSTAVFRIFQEALTNVMRHSGASGVNIKLMHKAGFLMLQVKDNGKGISENETFNPTSLGIVGMRERAIFLGGDVEIIGKPKKGTSITARIPLKR